jgi:peptidyl-prolyl cis-trans isomerase D
MMKFLRSQSQSVLILILVVLGGSFIFYGTGNVLNSGVRGGTDYGRIAGQDLSVAELYNAVHITHNSMLMSQSKVLDRPDATKIIAEEAWRQLLLLHEADLLHIEISDQELITYVQSIFQKDGAYSPELYQTVMSNLDNKFHITPDAFEAVVRSQLRSDAVRAALFLSVHASSRDITKQYANLYGPTQVSVITFDPKNYLGQVKVSPDEIQAEYKEHPDNPAYRTQEKRKVDYVLFPLTPEQMKLPQKDKEAAIDALGEKAITFALALQPDPSNAAAPTPPDFQAEAKKEGLSAETTDFFAVDAPPAGLPPSPAFNNAAFALTKDDPISKVVELDNGVAVLHLSNVQPSELRPLSEVQGDITKQLQQVKAGQTAQIFAQIDGQMLKSKTTSDADFAKAAAGLKLTPQTLPSFVPANTPASDPRLQTIAEAATQLTVGGVSDPLPIDSDQTIVVVHLDSRAAPDPAGLSEFETRFRNAQDQQVRTLAFIDWANWMSKQPGTHRPPHLADYGGVE